jgi:hypothetical protein
MVTMKCESFWIGGYGGMATKKTGKAGQQPVNQQLNGVSQDIGKLKDHLHIAQVAPTSGSSPLIVFAKMDAKKLAASRPELQKAVRSDSALAAAPDRAKCVGLSGTGQISHFNFTVDNSSQYKPGD